MFLGHISHEVFLRDYWQKKPLLIRQAFPDFDPIITADELAGMACETDTGRIVLEKDGQHPWELLQGPFDEEIFANLPESHWTLLVNDAEKLDEDLKSVIKPFRFLGDWKIDDLMISYATEEGSVGAHFDEYDVFLIQGAGKRRWQISSQPVSQDNFIPDIDLRIMREFNSEQEWVLEPGDLLYLPPNIAHYGIALDNECMTYSVGFHMPNREELLTYWAEDQVDNEQSIKRYSDTNSLVSQSPAELHIDDLKKLYYFTFNRDIENNQELLWLGKYLSQPKNIEPEVFDINQSTSLDNQFLSTDFYKSPHAKFFYLPLENKVHLFAGGMHIPCSLSLLPYIQQLCNSPDLIPPIETSTTYDQQELTQVVTTLFQQRLIAARDNESID